MSGRRVVGTLGALAAACVVTLFAAGPGYVERTRNQVAARPPYLVSETAARLHADLLVGDMHADSLLWNRDLGRRSSVGHVDLPRLAEGGVALQAFTVVTASPRGMNIHETSADALDNITLLAVVQRWPAVTFTSLLARAQHQANRLHQLAAEHKGALRVLHTRGDLRDVLAQRRQGKPVVGGLLGVEGAHCLEGKLENVEVLYQAGFRMVAPTHFFDNDLGGSAHGVAKGGLTDFGRAVVRELEARAMLIDLAHASGPMLDEVLAMATRPVVVSHTGVKGTCDNARNLTDAQLAKVAASGGLVGIGFWPTAVCGPDAGAIAAAIAYAAARVGPEHVALGSDFDGSVTTPFDASGMALVTEALLARGMPEASIRLVMGENWARLLGAVLPD